ncbi:hypothetical protein NQT62_02340 [Limnobacter humi]|uniref:Alpha/beta hydrolase n=1 Tax=Limnobacter humi TaxID=1778671 RepID=A0ABT1WCN2_9BURK|nr:hypothetical protein [Limnobacter humi]MCQ8895277.1 hypothetical protein [Limnobacter humi]
MKRVFSNQTMLTLALSAGALVFGLGAIGASMRPIDLQPSAPSVRSLEGASRVSEPIEYRSAQIVVDDPQGVKYNADVNALVRYPLDGDGPFPVVLYLHGRHVTCSYLGQEFLSTGECDLELPGVLGQPIQVVKTVDSYKGYDYMARNLAAHGYVVISINANDVNDKDLVGDAGVNARSQLILHHLDILREINKNGSYSAMNKPYALASLRGKIDMDHIGVMGHSRGGQAVTHVVGVNKARGATLEVGNVYPAGSEFNKPHNITSVFALAPTNFGYIAAPDVNFAVLLPYCDGDVSNLQGAFMFDKSRYVTEQTPKPKFQIVTMGANHNFYNTTWTGDDYSNTDSFCELGKAGNGRDNPLDQRRHGEFLMSSFFRYFLGNEQQFAGYWTGQASLPLDACPQATAKNGQRCEDRVHLSIQKPVDQRLVIDDTLDNQSLMTNNLNAANTAVNLDKFEFCNTTSATGTAAPAACPSARTQATAGQLVVESDNQQSSVVFNLGNLNSKAYDAVTFRVGLPVPTGTTPALTDAPKLSVTLTDTKGQSKTLRVADYSTAVYVPPGDATNTEGAKTLLNMVRLPLKDFAGIDFEHLKSLALEAEGLVKLQLTDVQLQALAGPLPNIPVSDAGGGTPTSPTETGTGSTGGTGATSAGNTSTTGGGGSMGWAGLLMLTAALAAYRRKTIR